MRIEQVKFSSGERLPMLLDDDGLPVPQVCEWLLRRRHLEFNTLMRNANEVVVIHHWARKRRFNIYERIRSGKQFTEADLQSLVEELSRPQANGNKVTKLAVSPDTRNKRLSTTLNHLKWYIDEQIADPASSPELVAALIAMRDKIVRIFEDAFQKSEPARKFHKSLTLKQVRFLQDVLDPEGNILFGRDGRGRVRNFIILCLLLFLGLRIGELLSLRVQDVKFGAISHINVRRRGMSNLDTRRRPARVKRNERILPIDNARLGILLADYIDEDRAWCLKHGKTSDSGFLFLSDEGDPLSADRVRQLFKDLRSRFPKDLPDDLTPHSMRYTFTNGVQRVLSSQGVDEERIKKYLAWLRGDSSLSSQDAYIDYSASTKDAVTHYQSQVSSGRNSHDVPF
ncbi:site-specific integrase [Pseudomonas coleopterorum]|uniref:site-specific integrase n=1 Tax=Pseudomonas coleopterorum TaxID=1605838 RepID=UPI002A6B8270|nr:site-specific integrase [Pseudomonas coleopterorum]MDY1019536.1 site-specific integrase [Pseudomonas coleopterorum]